MNAPCAIFRWIEENVKPMRRSRRKTPADIVSAALRLNLCASNVPAGCLYLQSFLYFIMQTELLFSWKNKSAWNLLCRLTESNWRNTLAFRHAGCRGGGVIKRGVLNV